MLVTRFFVSESLKNVPLGTNNVCQPKCILIALAYNEPLLGTASLSSVIFKVYLLAIWHLDHHTIKYVFSYVLPSSLDSFCLTLKPKLPESNTVL